MRKALIISVLFALFVAYLVRSAQSFLENTPGSGVDTSVQSPTEWPDMFTPLERFRSGWIASYARYGVREIPAKHDLARIVINGPVAQARLAVSEGDYRLFSMSFGYRGSAPLPHGQKWPPDESNTPYGVRCSKPVPVFYHDFGCFVPEMALTHAMWDYNATILEMAPDSLKQICQLNEEMIKSIAEEKELRASEWERMCGDSAAVRNPRCPKD